MAQIPPRRLAPAQFARLHPLPDFVEMVEQNQVGDGPIVHPAALRVNCTPRGNETERSSTQPAFDVALLGLDIAHKQAYVYRPQTRGKADRPTQSTLRGRYTHTSTHLRDAWPHRPSGTISN